MSFYNLGIDIGSTTIKYVLINKKNEILASDYRRHNAQIPEVLKSILLHLSQKIGDKDISVAITGSAGFGLAERLHLNFVQEVIAETQYIKTYYPECKTLINIGGEDAKIVFFKNQKMPEMRMSGNCSGGTGAFLDQMAVLMGCDIKELSDTALKSNRIYPMASRCGVFSKTDVQNLISHNVAKEDIAASVFHAVAVQIVGGLSKGLSIEPQLILSGGPFYFLPALKKTLLDYLNFEDDTVIDIENASILTAFGTAIYDRSEKFGKISDLIHVLENFRLDDCQKTDRLEPLFNDKAEYEAWKTEKETSFIPQVSIQDATDNLYVGIDSGSTTGKVIIIDDNNQIVYKYYTHNQGNPIQNLLKGIHEFTIDAQKAGRHFKIAGSCSTGYGEDLIKAAFNLNHGIVETMAHYLGAKQADENVSFILDIGGQDMKALFVKDHVIHRVEINEACSSGCGSFIEAFSKSLNVPIKHFAEKACFAKHPCDLGTRCTVFMNSKVKQFLREGVTIEDIAGGLSYSVIKNCLFKVLRIKSTDELGDHIVVQGGTMKNYGIVRALEKLIHKKVSFSDIPELMGAYGCALYGKTHPTNTSLPLESFAQSATYNIQESHCKGCDNKCFINIYHFFNGQTFISGNQCEKVFSNKGHLQERGLNIYTEKYKLLFDRPCLNDKNKLTIGIPRALGIYENYPFWHALFTNAGLNVLLSAPSSYSTYEKALSGVMSDNICFPAKLMHSHINHLILHHVNRIFYPFTVYEDTENDHTINSYNCPIVTAYSEVIKTAHKTDIPIDSPIVTFKNKKSLQKVCINYLKELNVPKNIASNAYRKALEAQNEYVQTMQKKAASIYEDGLQKNKLTILLAGRPYHSDPLVQHKLADMIAEFGVNVISEDIIRKKDINLDDTFAITQWSYINRIIKAAKWAGKQSDNVQFMEMTSFGCGPDSFLLDEVKSILQRYHKTLTILKIDDVNHIGSLRLRVRSLIESVHLSTKKTKDIIPFISNKIFKKDNRKMHIIGPYFSEFQSPVLPALFKLIGYDLEILPPSTQESVNIGLAVANNEVCFPATLVIGDIIKALKSGEYDLNNTAVILTQTGGQCRATNYSTLLKKALIDNGFENIPFIALGTGGVFFNQQPGFKIPWLKIAPIIIKTLIYTDCLSKLHAASIVRETVKGKANDLKEKYLNAVNNLIIHNKPQKIFELLQDAVQDFNAIINPKIKLPQIGIVGEIYLKFNTFAHRNIVDFLRHENIEVMPPQILPFFLQTFVNRKINKANGLSDSQIPEFIFDWSYHKINHHIQTANRICKDFPFYIPIDNIFEEAEHTKDLINLATQFGEGWLLPAEIAAYTHHNINHVISLQPFGCIANHIISKGIEKRLKEKYPTLNFLALDFDGGVSDVNVINRLLLFINEMK